MSIAQAQIRGISKAEALLEAAAAFKAKNPHAPLPCYEVAESSVIEGTVVVVSNKAGEPLYALRFTR